MSSRSPLAATRRAVRMLGALALALGAGTLAAPRALAQANDFVILFAGPDDYDPVGTDYTVIVQHVASTPGLKAFTFGYVASGGTLAALDTTGSDAEAALAPPISELVQDVSETPPGLCSKLIDPLAGTGSQLEWELAPMTASTMGVLTVRSSGARVSKPIVLQIASTLTCPSSDFTSPPTVPVVLARVCRRESFGANAIACAPPNASARRLRPNNLVAGGEFDTSLAGWSTPGLASASLDILDVDDSTTSSSVAVVVDTPIDGATGSLGSPCALVAPDTEYLAGASIQVSTGQARAGSAGVEVRWHSDATCTSPLATSARSDATQGPAFESIVAELVSPPGAASAEVLCTLEVAGATNSPFEARCDSIFLPEPGTGAGAAAAFATLAALARRRGARR